MSDPHQDLSNHGGAEKDGGGFCRKTVRQNVCEEKENRVPLFRFRKLRRKNKLPSSESRCCCFVRRRGNVGGGGCFGCFRRNPSDDSPVRSDPNSPNFTFELVRSMIEKNDFHCKECNTHFESEDDSRKVNEE